jgi:hypothetical protein
MLWQYPNREHAYAGIELLCFEVQIAWETARSGGVGRRGAGMKLWSKLGGPDVMSSLESMRVSSITFTFIFICTSNFSSHSGSILLSDGNENA